MADTSTERSRRLRRHRQGDHSLCRSDKCPALFEKALARGETLATPPNGMLGERGLNLWNQMTSTWTPSPLHAEMLLEACRMLDRLDRLDRQLRGEDWLRFYVRDDAGAEVAVYVDKALTEARELQTAFKALATELVKVAGAAEPKQKGGGVLNDLADELAARRKQAKG